ncbi:hypothetical protein CPAR01_16026 [Colletotrichum paranaense]|uniref:Uncharacterized protein n=1 Tax=Colletotrichum paranaense TaxID=1914294 RepID=A0ABQ9RXE9_9PEZI|nr:uncharacterized protein CPAR01_16026 [Colletotrichum paranaense]KAK1517546.1 hypothetical protein CPAR01_16026 [Colletotrichum paranaense]
MVPSSKPWDDRGSLKVIIRLFAWAGGRANVHAAASSSSSSRLLTNLRASPYCQTRALKTRTQSPAASHSTVPPPLSPNREPGMWWVLALSPLGKGESRKYLPWLVREGRAEPVGRALGRENLGRRLDGRVAKEGTRTARRRMADTVWFGGTLENWLEILVWA